MKRFRNLLVVQDRDGDTLAIREALHLAEQNDARVTIVKSLPEISGPILRAATGKVLNVEQMMREEALKGLEDAVDRLSPSNDIDVTYRLLRGVDFIEIIREVLRNKHDLVLKTGSHEIGFSEQLFGSLDLHLLRKCPCPVWLLTPERANRHRPRVMAAVNVTSDEPVHDHLNKVILELASSQAKRVGGTLDVVAGWLMHGESMLRGPMSGMTKEEVEGVITETRLRIENRLNELVASTIPDDQEYNLHLKKGNIAEVLAQFVTDKEITLMVMGTVGRTGLSGLLISNTVESLVGHVSCALLTVKPPGYETPVTLDD